MPSFHIPTYRVIRQSHQTWWITTEQAEPIFTAEFEEAGMSDEICVSNVMLHVKASHSVQQERRPEALTRAAAL